MKYKHLFWDFDGTLYDSYPQILNAMEQTLRSFSLPVPSKDELLRETKVLVSRALSTYGGNIPQMIGLTPKCPTICHFGAKDAHIPLVGAVDKIQSTHDFVAKLKAEYAAARKRLGMPVLATA